MHHYSFNFIKNKKQKIMTTQQVADRLVELCRMGQFHEAQTELFADDAVSIEPEHSPMQLAKGKEAIIAKGKMFQEMIEEHHGGSFSDPVIAGNYFTMYGMVENTMKGKGRMKMEEICLYCVKDGKIVSEQFFY